MKRIPSHGLTLIETLISLALITLIAGVDFGMGIDSYERSIARSSRTELLWSVLAARAKAMHGICDGDSCQIGTSQTVSLPNGENVTFSVLSGRVAMPAGSTDGSSTPLVNSEGQVSLLP